MSRIVLDPTGERRPAERSITPRPATLDGQVVGLLDISKLRGDVFLDRIEERLGQLGVTTRRFRKPTFTKPAPVDLRHEIATTCTMVIEALAD
jgi:hypothetical protein